MNAYLSGTVSLALGGALALVASQIHSRNRVDVFLAGLDILVAE